jgi:single-strand DNA-binding protein
MSANNNFTIIGNLTKAPELKTTKNDKKYTYVSLAVNGIKDKPDFISVLVWNKVAETITTYCKKGDCIALTGSIESYSKDGNTVIQLVANDAKFIYKAKGKEEPAKETKADSFMPEADIFAPA